MSSKGEPDNNPAARLLVVDDELDITGTLKTGLELLGFSVDAYNDPAEALSNFTASKYDLLILDIRMPRMSGFELGREIVKIDSKAKICFITAFEISPDEFRKLFPSTKAECFIKKPVGIAEVARVVREVLNSTTGNWAF